MQIYLSKEEIAREKNLFGPHEESYKLLEGAAFDIRSLKEQEAQAKAKEEGPGKKDSVPVTFVPPSC